MKRRSLIRRPVKRYGRYRGKGGYWGDKIKALGKRFIPVGSFARAGEWLGSATGVPGLGSLGGWGGQKLANYVGFGEYKDGGSVNQLIQSKGLPQSQQQISVNADETGDIVIRRTEFVQNIYVSGTGGTSSSFTIQKFPINAGVSGTFPMLSQIAQNFELYDFKGLMFQYKPTFSENAGSANNLGKVIMATNYDPDANDFFSSVQMENYDYANSTKPSCGAIHGVETKYKQGTIKNYYTRAVNQQVKDKSWTDLGNFYIATEGVPISGSGLQTQVIGELWVTYQCKVSRMQLYTNVLGQNIPFCFLKGECAGGAAILYSPLGTGVFSSRPNINTLACSIASSTSTSLVLSFPQTVNLGLFRFTLYFERTSGTLTTQQFTGFTNLNNCSMAVPGVSLPGTGVTGPFAPANTNATNQDRALYTFWVLVNSPGNLVASLQFNVNVAFPAGTWSAWIEGANYNCVTSTT